ncbi:hypothetical protein GJ496_011901 [Pomphorhynchus laevis]|nr:hypothetical protein GJ496_011901 [Pomphorhynchus laevis]
MSHTRLSCMVTSFVPKRVPLGFLDQNAFCCFCAANNIASMKDELLKLKSHIENQQVFVRDSISLAENIPSLSKLQSEITIIKSK